MASDEDRTHTKLKVAAATGFPKVTIRFSSESTETRKMATFSLVKGGRERKRASGRGEAERGAGRGGEGTELPSKIKVSKLWSRLYAAYMKKNRNK